MAIGDTLHKLGHVLEQWERGGAELRSVMAADEGGLNTTEGFSADVTLALPVSDRGTNDVGVECTPTISAEGSLAVTVETDLAVPSTTASAVGFEPVEADVDGGKVVVTGTITVEGNDTDERQNRAGNGRADEQPRQGSDNESETRAQSSNHRRASERDVPPFKNPELLQEVYDTNDTFAEMAEALDMDVTGETVRRYMIEYDIHQPNSYRTSAGSDSNDTPEESSTTADDTQQLVAIADGIGLPDGVSVEDVIETVNRSNTIYEVKTDLDLGRQEAHEMLKDLNLMDLVLGRLSDDSGREITREDVVDRLRQVSEAR